MTSEASAECSWCHKRTADGGLDAIGEPWCAECRDAETRVQDAKRAQIAREAAQ